MKAAPRALRLPGPMALAMCIGERSDAVPRTAMAGCLTSESENVPAASQIHRRHSGARAQLANPESSGEFGVRVWIRGSRP
jgi:hypothetical protein